jgi:hypothetical protein
MKEDISDAEWERPKGNSINLILVILVLLNPFMYFFVMPMEQSQVNRHTASLISIFVFLAMVISLILGIINWSKNKKISISYLLIVFNLIFWLYALAQVECYSCSKV